MRETGGRRKIKAGTAYNFHGGGDIISLKKGKSKPTQRRVTPNVPRMVKLERVNFFHMVLVKERKEKKI